MIPVIIPRQTWLQTSLTGGGVEKSTKRIFIKYVCNARIVLWIRYFFYIVNEIESCFQSQPMKKIFILKILIYKANKNNILHTYKIF